MSVEAVGLCLLSWHAMSSKHHHNTMCPHRCRLHVCDALFIRIYPLQSDLAGAKRTSEGICVVMLLLLLLLLRGNEYIFAEMETTLTTMMDQTTKHYGEVDVWHVVDESHKNGLSHMYE